MSRSTIVTLALAFTFGLSIGCEDHDDMDDAGASCDTVDDCYPDVDHAELQGQVECLDRVPGGYCTHHCETDADCCAVDGECESGFPQVCAPFENSTQKRCFLSCEPDVVGDQDATDFCHENAHREFECRSTGGGSMNRQVCA